MLLPTALGLLLCATPAPDSRGLSLDNPVDPLLEPEWVHPRPVAEVRVSDDGRVKRFVGALVGGLVGAAATMALQPLGDMPSVSVVSPLQGFLTLLTPLMTMTGAFVGYQVMGGDGGFLTAWASMLPAGLALSLLLFTVPPELRSVDAFMPQVVTGLVLLSAASALALELRARQLEGLGARRGEGSASAGRVAAEGIVTLLALLASIAQAAIGVALVSSFPGNAVVGTALGVLGAGGTALTTWGVHRSSGGKGSLLASVLGLLLGAGGGALAATLTVFATAGRFGSPLGTLGPLIAIAIPSITTTVSSTLAIEWSHTMAVGEAETAGVSLGAAPTAGGAMVSAGLRF